MAFTLRELWDGIPEQWRDAPIYVTETDVGKHLMRRFSVHRDDDGDEAIILHVQPLPRPPQKREASDG